LEGTGRGNGLIFMAITYHKFSFRKHNSTNKRCSFFEVLYACAVWHKSDDYKTEIPFKNSKYFISCSYNIGSLQLAYMF
jgi:hypothetical protein